MIIEKKEPWKLFAEEAEEIFDFVTKQKSGKELFTPLILYNLLYIGIKKYLIAYLLYNNVVLKSCTIKEYVDSVKESIDMEDELYNNLLHIDEFQDICEVNLSYRKIPDKCDVDRFFTSLHSLRKIVLEKIPDYKAF